MEVTPLVVAFDRKFFIPGLVAIKSLVDNISDKSRIEIFVLHNNLPYFLVRLAEEVILSYDCTVTFIDLSHAFEGISCRQGVPKEIYYSLFIPQYFKSYDKAVKLDVDMLFRDDLLKIIDGLPSEKKVGAVRCVFRHYIKYGDFGNFRLFASRNGIRNVDNYFNGGVVVFNNRLITDQERSDCISLIEKHWSSNDEMILNYVFQDSLHLYSLRWNFQIELESEPSSSFSDIIRQDLDESRSDVAVCHFMGPAKPWNNFSFTEESQVFLEEYRKVTKEVLQDIKNLAPSVLCGPMWEKMTKL